MVSGIVSEPVMPSRTELDQPNTLFHGLPERIVAVESCLYLADQINHLVPQLRGADNETDPLGNLFSQEIVLTRGLRAPIYYSCLLKVINLDQIVPMMGKVSWDLREVKSQHSAYVDLLLKQLQVPNGFFF